MTESEADPPPPTLDTLGDDVLQHVSCLLIAQPATLVSFSRACSCFATATRSARQQSCADARIIVHDEFSSSSRCEDCLRSGRDGAFCEHARSIMLCGKASAPLVKRDALVLAHALRHQPVTSLVFDFAGGGVDASALVVLARDLLPTLESLAHLSLAGCAVRDEGARAVARAVGRTRSLRSLAMEDNPFSATARGELRRACRPRNVTLTAYSEIENESLYD